MSTQLEEKLNKILAEKKEKILPENIRKGIKLFDVDGSLEILDTSDADATSKDIAMNKTAYVNGEKITGTLLEPSMSSISTDNIIDTGSRVDIEGKMPTDYLFRKNSSITYNIKYPNLANAIGLTSEKIMKGNTVIGVSGNATSDATATASDILKDKTAYVNGVKIVGTYEKAGEDNNYNSLLSNKSNLTLFKLITWINEISSIDLIGVTEMKNAFSGCNNLKSIGALLNTENVTDLEYAFRYCHMLEQIPLFDTSSVTTMSNCFTECSSIVEIPQLNTMNVKTFVSCFDDCPKLETIPLLDMRNATNIRYVFRDCPQLKNIGGFKDLGKAYTQQSTYTYYALALSGSLYLTHDSLMNIINNLYDLNLTYNVANGGTLYTQKLELGPTNLAKLTAEEIAIATERGWSVS